MVVFRLRGENHLTERLLKRLNARGNLHCVPAALKGRYVIRFTVTSQRTTGDDITRDWAEIRAVAAEVLGEEKQPITTARARVPLAGTCAYSIVAYVHRENGDLVVIWQMELPWNSTVWV
jgi:histidine decarboxylase